METHDSKTVTIEHVVFFSGFSENWIRGKANLMIAGFGNTNFRFKDDHAQLAAHIADRWQSFRFPVPNFLPFQQMYLP